ncbi:immediate early response 2b [Brienomyrus brachyistius]|uniref:immediate early response 2b n=1 Tax=Brienomyrus brachyistius TaxID=42636 RepID=UPI0020B1B2EF|nr:immediate early response 2b [Brienomyrus brachyistius]
MDVSAEAKRIIALSLTKLYGLRSQRGGLRLQRSLMLSLVMKSARNIYHNSRVISESQASGPRCVQEPTEEPKTETPAAPCMGQSKTSEGEWKPRLSRCEKSKEDKENRGPSKADRQSRKRRSKAAGEPDFLPSKRARMETGEEGRTVSFMSVGVSWCRATDGLSAVPLAHAIAAF